MITPERLCVCGRPESSHTNVAALRGEIHHFFQRQQVATGSVSTQEHAAELGAQREKTDPHLITTASPALSSDQETA